MQDSLVRSLQTGGLKFAYALGLKNTLCRIGDRVKYARLIKSRFYSYSEMHTEQKD